MVIVLWRNNFKSIPRIEEYQRSHNCCSCTIADTKQNSGDSSCTIVLLSFSNVLQRISIKYLQHSSELAVALGFYSSAMISLIITTFNHFWSFQSSGFWWSSEPLMMSASGRQLLMRVLLMTSSSGPLVFITYWLQTSCLQNSLTSGPLFLQHKLPSCKVLCSNLFFRTYTS